MKKIFVVLLLLFAGCAHAQQMAVMKKGRILQRYYLGDEIRFILKGDKQKYHAVVASIQEFSFTTMQRDTIKFLDIAKLKFKSNVFKLDKITTSTLIGSAALTGLHFALKPSFGKKNPQSVNGILYVAEVGMASLVLSKIIGLISSHSSMKLTGWKRLKFINYDSPLYR